MKDLITRIKEKPIKYAVQIPIGMTFLYDALETAIKGSDLINKYESQINNALGSGGCYILQNGLTITQIVVSLALGFIATKGAGMLIDKDYYQTKQV